MLRTLLLIVVSFFPAVLHATQATTATEVTPATQATSATEDTPATEAAGSCTNLNAQLGRPSCEAADMPGALGTCEYTPQPWQQGTTTFWKDSDGVAPGTPGCHRATNDKGVPINRWFGEACRRNNTELIESNPGRGKLHLHENDLGHPDVFNCAQWCQGTGRSGGSCVTVGGPSPCAQSAWCQCTG